MNLAEGFIRRPVMTTLISLAIVFFGLMAYRMLPVSDLPNVDFPTLLVTASLPGASPETMASSIATPLERQFSTIAGLDQMSSTSMQGLTSITLEFALDRNIDAAAQDVQAAITAALSRLPQGMPSPPSYEKVNPADKPVLYLGLSSPTLPLSQVDEYAETYLAERISMISGVAQVVVYGSQKYAVRIQIDPQALAYRGIGIDEVARLSKTPTSTCPPARSTVRMRPSPCRPTASSPTPLPTDRLSWPTKTVRRCGWKKWARCSTVSRTTRWQDGSGPTRGGARDPAAAGHQHGRGGQRDRQRSCRLSAPSCRPRSASRISTRARIRSRPRLATCSSRCC